MKKLPGILFVFLLVGVSVGAELPEWSPEAIDLFATLPVQEAGRVKPLDTIARFTLLRFNGKRTLTIQHEGGGRSTRSALEWLLDSFFFPEIADTYRCFSVESYEAIVALGLEPHGKKRDRYSYNDLKPGLERLMTLARQASDTPQEDRGYLDAHLINLANNLLAYESLTQFLDFARTRFAVEGNVLLSRAFTSGAVVRTSDIMAAIPGQLAAVVAAGDSFSEEEREHLGRGMHELFSKLDAVALTGRLFALLPPDDPEQKVWMSPADAIENAFDAEYFGNLPVDLFKTFERLVDEPISSPAFLTHLGELHSMLTTLAANRDEYHRIPLEVHFYRGRYMFFAQWLFVLSFVLVAGSWLLPKPGRISLALNLSLLPPILALAAGITLRCIIRGRPPVTTLYETILFTALVAALLGFLVEFISRNRISMSIGSVLGVVGMFFAWRYEASEAKDTMPAVIAVLDTNFWLATHVTTIIVGYGAGLFASGLAHVYVIARILRLKSNAPAFYPDLGRVIYGTVAFSLVFTLIGTVLGGVWAAESWGRFWGWDPKENGALLIILWALAFMHAKRGGYIRQDGIALSTIALGMIVVFAWWGVNALGVGLHSYGFISGVWRALTVFWLVECAIVFVTAGAIRLHSGGTARA